MKRVLFLCLMLLIVLPSPAQHQSKKYYCPPCNCSNDGHIFDNPGICSDPICKMELLAVEGPYQESKLKFWIKFLRSDWMLGFYDVLILPAIIQGFILSLLLVFRRNANKVPSGFLAMLVIGLSVQNIKFYYLAHRLNDHISTVGGNPEYSLQSLSFPFTGILFIGPALYFYVRSLTISDFRFTYKQLLHFLPGLLFILINSLFYIISHSEKPPEHAFIISAFSQLSSIENLLAISSSFYYILSSTRSLRRHEAWIHHHFSTTSRNSLLWLRNLLIILSLVWIIWLFAVTINLFTHDFILTYLSSYPFQIATSIIIFWIGYVGFIHGEIFSMQISLEKKIGSLKPVIKHEPEVNDEVKKMLLNAMETEKLFLIPDLSLAMLAHQLNISPKNISQALNRELNKNFHDFVNEYRVEEIKKRLVSNEYDHLTMVAIAMDSGFNSKSSFNRIFMKVTGMSPKQFRERGDKQVTS